MVCRMGPYKTGIDISEVPVIAVFTKYDHFRRKIWFQLEDRCTATPAQGPQIMETEFHAELESVFKQRYLDSLARPPPFVQLESENF
jgi:hypothetical protein